MPRPRATIFHRQAQHTVVSPPMPAAAASARASTVRIPSRNGPVPSCQTRTASVPAAPAKRAHVHTARAHRWLPIGSGQDQQVGVIHGDGELSGGCLRQAPARVGAGLGGQLELLLARRIQPPGEPLRRQLGLRGRRAARDWAGRGHRHPAGGTRRRRTRRHPDRAGARHRSCGAGGRRMPRPRGSPVGSARGQVDATDDGQGQQHGTACARAHAGQPGQLLPGQQVQQRRGGDQRRIRRDRLAAAA